MTEEFAPRRAPTWPLLEREAEIARLQALTQHAKRGRGRAVLVQGPAGIGKSRLLAETQSRALAAGLTVLAARGGELERDHGFGVVTQLLEPPLSRAPRHQRGRLIDGAAGPAVRILGDEGPPIGDEHRALHALYWLTANLCEQAPVLMVIDDLQYVDAPSLRFLIHLSRRVEGLNLGLVLALRAGEPLPYPDLVRALIVEVTPPLLMPRALSPSAVATLVQVALGGPPDSEVLQACAEASAGNPFLLIELLEGLTQDGARDRLTAAQVRAFAPDRVAAAVMLRLQRQGDNALRVARAVAVLGRSATREHVAALADVADAGQVATALSRAEILTGHEPLSFVHPLVRAAVYDDMSTTLRREQHRQAAAMLAAAGAPAEAVALHLMHVDPAGDQTAVASLRDAAVAALSRGATEAAVSYLRRALAEPPAPEARVELLTELGFAATRTGDPRALGYIEEAFGLTLAQPQRAAVGLRLLAASAASATAPERTVEILGGALEGAEDTPLPVPLEEMTLLFIVGLPALRPRFYERVKRARERLRDLTPAMLAAVASDMSISGESADEAAKLGQRALAAGELLRRDIETDAALSMPAIFTLLDTGRYRAARRAADAGVLQARASGSRFALVRMSAVRGLVHYRCGAMALAEADARECEELASEPGWQLAAALSAAVLAAVQVERGETELALGTLRAAPAPPGVEESIALQFLRESRVRVLIAADEPEAALAELEAFERWTHRWGVAQGVAPISWRSLAAAAQLRLGRILEARRLAEEELELARRFGALPKLGEALIAVGLAHEDGTGTFAIEEAVSVLETSDARLEHARAVIELGARRLRNGDLAQARDVLAKGLDLAHRCGARALVERAHAELIATGARPRRLVTTGPDALTPSELRICEFAARGLTNKQIAQALFLTVRTVEMHLSNAYRRLEIASRAELSGALAQAEGAAA